VTFQLLDVDCPSCISDARKVLERQAGVVGLHINQMLNIFYIDYEPGKITEEELGELMRRTGYKAVKLRSMRDNRNT
jgi:cation transport ATPase